MSLGSGPDLGVFVELDPRGCTDLTADGILDETIGDHVGDYRGLNIVNPQPGCEYVWMLDPERGGATNRMADFMAIRTSGGEIVKKGDPEMAAFEHIVGSHLGAQEKVSNGEVILVRIPIEEVARRREEQLLRNRALLTGGEERFLAGASMAESQAGQGEATRFRHRKHQLLFEEGGAPTSIHTPTGIVRGDDLRTSDF